MVRNIFFSLPNVDTKSEEQHKHEVSNVVFEVGIVFDEFVHMIRSSVV